MSKLKTNRYNVTYFIGDVPFQERVDVSAELDFIDGSGDAIDRVQIANPDATDLIAVIL